ncbi:MAG: TonB-dependent receptor [Balneolaceae bacterium]|nr:TonB-dependent receptor [Balneolaceae bacterium]
MSCIVWAALLMAGPLHAQEQSGNEEYYARAAQLYPNISINTDEPKSAALSKIISVRYNRTPFLAAVSDIANKAGYWLSYSDQYIPEYRSVSLKLENVTVQNALWAVLEDTGLRYAISPNGHLVLMKWEREEAEDQPVIDGVIVGYVYDSRTGDPLPGANVRIAGTSKGTATDDGGQFVLSGVSAGDQVLVVSYLGYETQRVDVEVEDDDETEIEIELQDNFVEMDGILVRGTREGQVRALSRQKDAANIKNVIDAELISTFPDPNVGESLKRIPGINVQSDQGEARFVQIRGASPTLNNVSINGEQLAAPEGDERSVNLDMIPSDVLASIEVTKAITPDMDGDAIGGTINLETKSAISRDREFNVTLNGGYHNNVNDFSPLGGRASVNYGQRVGDDAEFGYMIGANYNRNSIGSDNNEVEYDEGNLDEMQLRDYELIRERIGVSSNFDYRFSRSSKLLFKASYNYFDDLEYRRRLTLTTDEALRELKDRLEKQKVFSASFGGEHAVSETFFVDYRIAYSYSDQNTPKDREIGYAQAFEDMAGDDIDFIGFDRSDPDYPQFSLTSAAPAGAGVYNYGSYEFDEMADASEFTSEDHITTRLNLRKDYALSDDVSGFLKFGGKLRFKSKERGLNENIYGDYGGGTTFEDLLSDFEDDDFLFGNYAQGPGLFPGVGTMNDFIDNNLSDFELDEEDSQESSTAEDYDASEDTYAGYIMTDLQIGNLGTVIGLRYEHVESEYTGHIVEYNDAEELVTPIPTASDKNEYDFILPMVHLKYQIQDNINLRLAWTNTFAKPNYFNQVPFRIISRPDEEIELGNPDLDPTRSTNFDFMAEYYFQSIGIFSAGVFYKNIRDFIYTANFAFSQAPYVGYEATQPINGEDADLAGFEVALQNQLTFLPGFASGFGIYANYTYTWSEARLLTEGGAFRTVQLPGQAQNMANLAISYQRSGFNGRVSLNYSGSFIEEIRETRSADRYYDKHTQIDISLSQQVTDEIQIFADVINLTNEPLRFYNGVPSRPEQQEYYSWWSKLGVQLEL